VFLAFAALIKWFAVLLLPLLLLWEKKHSEFSPARGLGLFDQCSKSEKHKNIGTPFIKDA